MEKSVRVVIVGGTGNISRGVVKSLIAYGHEITIFNRGQMSGPVPPSVRVIVGDRKDRSAFEGAMQAERFDAAIDMICFSAEDAESTARAFRGVRHLIYTSTCAIYGGPLDEYPTNESSPRRPVIPYSVNKVAADEVLYAAERRGDFPMTVIQPAQTWGYQPRLLRQLGRDTRWIDRIRRGKPVLICHDGQLVWPSLHADDAGPAYAGALGREECFGQTYIMTVPGYPTWRDYYDGIGTALGKNVEYVDAPVDYLIKAWPENTELLVSESRWNRIYDTSKIQRDIPEFNPQRATADAGPYLKWLDEQGLIPDARDDETEDRIICEVEHRGTIS